MSDIKLFNTIENMENKNVISTLIVIMFFLSGINKLHTFTDVVSSLKQKLPYNFPSTFYTLAIIAVILVETLSPIFIINYTFTGKYKQQAQIGVLTLIIFTFLATVLYHPPDFNNYRKSMPFWANISLLGGLLLLSKNLKKNTL